MIDNRLKKEKFRKDVLIKDEKKDERKGERKGLNTGKRPMEGLEKKREEKGGKKSGEKTWQKSGDRSGKKAGEKVWEKTGDKSDKRSGEKTWEKSGNKFDKRSGEKTWEKTGDKSDRRTGEKAWEKSGNKSDRRTGEKTWEKTGNKFDRRAGEKTWEKSGDKSDRRAGEKAWEKSGNKSDKRTGEKTWEKPGNKYNKNLGEKVWKKTGEWSDKKSGEKTRVNPGEKSGRNSGENTWQKTGEWSDKKQGEKARKYPREKSGKNSEKETWRKSEEWSDKKLGDKTRKNSVEKSDKKFGEKPSKWRKEGTEGQQRGDRRAEDKVFPKGKKNQSQCPVFRKCGGCQLLDMPYKKQLELKQKQLETLLKPYCRLEAMIGMEDPYHYRNKVHAVFDHNKGNPFSGVYEANTHRVVPVESCLIEDEKADEIIGTIRGMLKSFKILTYDEDTGYGLLRHVLIRRGFTTGEIMVVLVTSTPIFPSKNNFVKALRDKHPEITTVIQNINGRETSMVLGDKEHVLYGKGYIEDILCGYRFRISSKSFYQVNPVQTEILYKKAIEAAGLTGKERVIDAYCGIGTIGIVASQYAKEVIGVELNRDAVKDAIENAKLNVVSNAKFYCNDAGKFMENMAESGEHVDVVFLDPPRSGSTVEFIDSVAKLKPAKVVYVSCGPETLARDLELFRKKGYEARKGWGIDLFPMTNHTELIVEICQTKTRYM